MRWARLSKSWVSISSNTPRGRLVRHRVAAAGASQAARWHGVHVGERGEESGSRHDEPAFSLYRPHQNRGDVLPSDLPVQQICQKVRGFLGAAGRPHRPAVGMGHGSAVHVQPKGPKPCL